LIPVSNDVSREGANFDDWLAAELRRELAPHTMRPAPAPRYRMWSGARRRGLSIFTGTSAALGAKAATGFVVTAFAVVATGAAVTGSTNPAVWGAHVRTAVADCKSDLDRGQRGWGDCVSSVSGQVQAQGPAPVVEAPTPTPLAASQARVDEPQKAPVKTTDPPKVVKPPDTKPIVPPRPVRTGATPKPTPTAEPDENRDLPPGGH
jgi:hypothetical protein